MLCCGFVFKRNVVCCVELLKWKLDSRRIEVFHIREFELAKLHNRDNRGNSETKKKVWYATHLWHYLIFSSYNFIFALLFLVKTWCDQNHFKVMYCELFQREWLFYVLVFYLICKIKLIIISAQFWTIWLSKSVERIFESNSERKILSRLILKIVLKIILRDCISSRLPLGLTNIFENSSERFHPF